MLAGRTVVPVWSELDSELALENNEGCNFFHPVVIYGRMSITPHWQTSPHSPWHRMVLFLIVVITVSSCAGAKDPLDGSTLIIDRENVKSWDPSNLWAECATAPKHYFPRGMKKGTPLDEKNGRWVVDPQDGWRFYVPHEGKSPHSQRFLEQAVQNATNKHSKKFIPLFVLRWLMIAGLRSGGNLHG
jgi:hypothetical protein